MIGHKPDERVQIPPPAPKTFDSCNSRLYERSRKEFIHRIVRAKYKNCPVAWTQVKKRIAEDDAGFIFELKQAFNNCNQFGQNELFRRFPDRNP